MILLHDLMLGSQNATFTLGGRAWVQLPAVTAQYFCNLLLLLLQPFCAAATALLLTFTAAAAAAFCLTNLSPTSFSQVFLKLNPISSLKPKHLYILYCDMMTRTKTITWRKIKEIKNNMILECNVCFFFFSFGVGKLLPWCQG